MEKEENENVASINVWNSRYNVCKYFDKYNEVHISSKSTFIPEYGDVNTCKNFYTHEYMK